MSNMHLFIEYTDDSTGNRGIAGVWEVPDDFEPSAAYAIFCAGFVAAHPTKSGRLTERQRVTQSHQWVKYLNGQFKRVPHTHRE